MVGNANIAGKKTEFDVILCTSRRRVRGKYFRNSISPYNSSISRMDCNIRNFYFNGILCRSVRKFEENTQQILQGLTKP